MNQTNTNSEASDFAQNYFENLLETAISNANDYINESTHFLKMSKEATDEAAYWTNVAASLKNNVSFFKTDKSVPAEPTYKVTAKTENETVYEAEKGDDIPHPESVVTDFMIEAAGSNFLEEEAV